MSRAYRYSIWCVYARFGRIETSPDKVSFQNKSKNDLLNISRHDSRLWPNKTEIPRHYTTYGTRGRGGAGGAIEEHTKQNSYVFLQKKKAFLYLYTTNTAFSSKCVNGMGILLESLPVSIANT